MGVFAQRFAADGTPTGPEFRVNVSEDGKQFYPSVAMLADGGFAIGFHESDAEDDRLFEVKCRRFDSNGEADDEFQLNTYTDAVQKAVRVASGPDGFIAVWESLGQDGDAYGVFGRSYDTVMGEDAEEWQINEIGDRWQQAPAVATGADGRIVVVWQENDGYGEFKIRTRVFEP
ncbi:MAG: hypothetical protein ABI333_07785 [bacterium]